MLYLLAVLKQENRKQDHKSCIHCRDKHNVSERETSNSARTGSASINSALNSAEAKSKTVERDREVERVFYTLSSNSPTLTDSAKLIQAVQIRTMAASKSGGL